MIFLACPGPIPDWQFFVAFITIGFMCGFLLASAIFSAMLKAEKKYVKGLKEDRECRDNFIREKLGRDADLPYCEDDDL